MKILDRIDSFLCRFFGLLDEETKPFSLKLINNKLIILATCSFKRHVLKERWVNFSSNSLTKVNEINKGKLGVAMGQALAKNLVISFDEVHINEEK